MKWKKYLKDVDFVVITKHDNGKIIGKVTLKDRRDINKLWNAIDYNFFFDRYHKCSKDHNDKFIVWYPIAKNRNENDKHLFFSLGVTENGEVTRVKNLKTIIKYNMTNYSKCVKSLYYKKHRPQSSANYSDIINGPDF